MFKTSIMTVAAVCVLGVGTVCSQEVSLRTAALVQSLDKTKHKKKEKKNITVEVYVDIKNEPVVRTASEYAGVYENGDDQRLELRVSGSTVSGSGRDILDFKSNARMDYTLRDARIEGALLTATKVYANGETQPFEAVFVNRTHTAGKNPNEITTRESMFGIGYVVSSAVNGWTNRVFLVKR